LRSLKLFYITELIKNLSALGEQTTDDKVVLQTCRLSASAGRNGWTIYGIYLY